MPPRGVEELRVDDAPDGAVDAGVADALEQRERARARDLDLAERAEVDDADALAEGLVLGRQQRLPRRLAPAERALVLARRRATALPGSKWSARSQPFFGANTAPSSSRRPCSGLRRRPRAAVALSSG